MAILSIFCKKIDERAFMDVEQTLGSEWYLYLDPTQKELVKLSLQLYEREKQQQHGYADYSFVLFPLSKAYEGFLKKYLFDSGLISLKTYEGTRFRIGRALNPDINPNQHDDRWLFDDLAKVCGADVSRQIWDAWLKCRNRVFHFFPKEEGLLPLDEIGRRMQLLIAAMEAAIACKL